MPDLRPAVAEIERVAPKSEKPHERGIPAWGWTSAGIGAVGLYIVFYLYSISQLVAAWRSGDADSWNLFWHDPFDILLLYPAFMLFRWYAKQMPTNPFAGWNRLAEAHWKALEDGGAGIPLAEPQPNPDPDDSPAIARRTLTPLIRPKRLRDSGIIALAVFAIVVATALGVIAVLLFLAWMGDLNPGAGLALLILSAFTLCCAATAYVTLRWRPRTSAPISVTVDEEGLQWRESIGRRSQRYIAWKEARAFITFSWRNESSFTTYEAYALITPHAVFTWELTQLANRKTRHAHDELAGLILTRAGLPLRSLTKTFEVALQPPAAPEKPKIRFPLGTPGTPDAVPGIPAPDLTPEPPEVAARARRRQLRLRALAVATIVPLLLLDGAGMYLQREQPHYFASYLTRAEALPALYVDHLSVDDSQWLDQHPSLADSGDYTFTQDASSRGVYQMSGANADYDLESPEPQYFSNAVVEVSTRQLHAGTNSDAGGVGLILRSSYDTSQYIEYYVDPNGNWDLTDYSGWRLSDAFHYIDSGTSNLIHQGVGAVNRLAIVMRGNDLILYVNGQFLATETDTDAIASGQAGLYVESETTGGQFYDFAVYPLPADPPLLGWG